MYKDARMRWELNMMLLLAAFLAGLASYAQAATVELWFTASVAIMNPDCLLDRPTVVVNGTIPGPSIYATEGDDIVVHILNNQSLPLTVHWHGIYQRHSQWYDGPTSVTQCPIPPNSTFTYRFKVEGQYGTFWWHAHSAMLRGSVFGALVVYPPASMLPEPYPSGVTIAEEQNVLLGDWNHESTVAMLRSMIDLPFIGYPVPHGLLINGRTGCRGTPYVLTVQPGKWYRLRIANTAMLASQNFQIQVPLPSLIAPPVIVHHLGILASQGGGVSALWLVPASSCGDMMRVQEGGRGQGTEENRLSRSAVLTHVPGCMRLLAQGHVMYLFEADGHYVKQEAVTSLDTSPGQTFSVLFQANQTAANYWMATNPRFELEPFGVKGGLAVLHYSTAPWMWPSDDIPVGPTESSDPDFGTVQQGIIRSRLNNSLLPQVSVDRLLMFQINLNINDKRVEYSVNNVTSTPGVLPTLYADYHNISGEFDVDLMPPIATSSDLNANEVGPSKKGPSLIDVEFGDFVQVVLQNHIFPNGHHPFHLHGQDFWLVGRGEGTFNASAWESYEYNLQDPPQLSTVMLYDSQWLALRFRANNPGVWLLHCHVEPHMGAGMMAVLRVKGPPGSIPAPPDDYPECPSVGQVANGLNITGY
eukprot:jgi/Mesen1/4304/ME000022S03593